MGDIAQHWYDAPQLADLGWLSTSQVTTALKTGTYTLGLLESTTATTRTVRIPINAPLHGAYLYIEHRTDAGEFDQFGTDNVTKVSPWSSPRADRHSTC